MALGQDFLELLGQNGAVVEVSYEVIAIVVATLTLLVGMAALAVTFWSLLERRFEKSDARLGQMRAETDQRFDKSQAEINQRFNEFRTDVSARFDKVDLQFEKVNAQFEKVDTQFERIDGRLDRIDERIDRVDSRIDGLSSRIDAVVDSRLVQRKLAHTG